MKISATSPDEYVSKLERGRQEPFKKLRDTVKSNLPPGFEECMSYGMIGYVVPLSTYPEGYHCNPVLPLPFINIASQKNYLALYHSCAYSDPALYNWIVQEYPKHAKYKLDMGKSCMRFKKMDDIPYELIGELCSKVTPKEWIAIYEKVIKR
jgi:hypothetical protein